MGQLVVIGLISGYIFLFLVDLIFDVIDGSIATIGANSRVSFTIPMVLKSLASISNR